MRIVFMGTPEFSVAALVSLVEAGHQVAGVVTQPDKPKGRGKQMQFPPVKEKAIEYGIPVFQPQRVKEEGFLELLKGLEPELIVVVAFGQMLPQSILELPKYGCINIHASLLPKYRGAAPIQWVIIDGEKETGVTTMMMDVGLDTGDMLMKEVISIDKKETGGSLHDKLSAAGGDLILKTIEKLEAGTLTREKQDDTQSCYAKMLTKTLGKMDFQKPAAELERLIRGLNPWPSAYTTLDGKTLKVWDADVVEKEYQEVPGTVVEVSGTGIVVATGQGGLELKEIQLEGKKRMTADNFLRGYPVAKGVVLL
ncbi:methionyl-tRNA formyltransferase [Anaeromicropila populeti]|uniref:Methionyl-tRNA formyltransferase n=1 Tax=Anaeromicropila populeti TaxID=37658 RepID=A0A1I6KXD3_9FIRM|nr:methionyl-tRNA formyltransferase [Anaeromicropila populeti]SFR95590.1 methionyl-tRNA formyltransferase [Anaeromicropila populeti]